MHHYKTFILAYLYLATMLTSCTLSSAEDNEIEMTAIQTEAFDALNTLQRNTQGHLFSTFVDAQNAFEEPDTSFNLTQEELKSAISRITNRYGTDLSPAEFEELAAASVLAQEDYKVEYYSLFDCAEKIGVRFNGLPTTGKWIIRSILNRRDLILEW